MSRDDTRCWSAVWQRNGLCGSGTSDRCRTAPSSPPPPPRGAVEGKGPQRWPQRRLDRRLEEVVEAVGGGYCRLQMPLKPAFGVRGTVAGHRLGALEGGGGGLTPPHPPSNASLGGGLLALSTTSLLYHMPHASPFFGGWGAGEALGTPRLGGWQCSDGGRRCTVTNTHAEPPYLSSATQCRTGTAHSGLPPHPARDASAPHI